MPIFTILWFGSKSKVRRVPDGQTLKRKCPECGETALFRECVVKKEYSVYSVVTLWDSTSTAYACSACDSVMSLGESQAPQLTAREEAKQRKLEEKEARVAEKRRKAAALEAEKAKRSRDAQIDSELEALKRKLSK